MLTHDQERTAMRLWTKLEEARDIVAGARSSVFLSSRDVDSVTLKIVDLQGAIEQAIRDGQVPDVPPLKLGA